LTAKSKAICFLDCFCSYIRNESNDGCIGEHRQNFFLHACALISTKKGKKAEKVESRKVEGPSRKSRHSHLSEKLQKGVKSVKVQKCMAKS
jgi:hypothetical protein